MTMIPYYIGRLMPLAALGIAGIGVILVQVWLCRRKYSLWGMILPVLSFFCMLDQTHVPLRSLWSEPLRVRLTVCVPTLVLLLVYYLCRCAGRRQAELWRMRIQDLG